MAGGSCTELADLPENARELLHEARRAVLVTIDPMGSASAVPVCFALRDADIVTPVDAKPKAGRRLARLKNLDAHPAATVLFDRWDEDWRRLAWVMVKGTGRVEPPGTGSDELAARYAQYKSSPPPGEVIVVRPQRVLWWAWSESAF